MNPRKQTKFFNSLRNALYNLQGGMSVILIKSLTITGERPETFGLSRAAQFVSSVSPTFSFGRLRYLTVGMILVALRSF